MKTSLRQISMGIGFRAACLIVTSILATTVSGCTDELVDKPVELRNPDFLPVSLDETGAVIFGLQSVGQRPISGNGRFVTYYGYGKDYDESGEVIQVYLTDTTAGTSKIISRGVSGEIGDGNSHAPSVNDDGDSVTFVSFARNFPTNLSLPEQDIFDSIIYQYDVSSNKLVSPDVFCETFVNISGDGDTACFIRNNYPVCLKISTGETTVISMLDEDIWSKYDDDYQFLVPVPNRDGSVLAVVTDRAWDALDDNSLADIYVIEDGNVSQPERISMGTDGEAAGCESHSPVVSADGSKVAFVSCSALADPEGATEDWTVYVFDRTTGELKHLLVENASGTSEDDEFVFGGSDTPSISDDGRYVSFEQLRDDEWTIYVWDLVDDIHAPAVSADIADPADVEFYRGAFANRISADGTRILFKAFTYHYGQWSKNTIYTAPNPLISE